MSETESYWIESLQDYPVLDLPTDYLRPTKQQFSGLTEEWVIDEETTEQIKGLLQKYNVTGYMFSWA